jgi:hypothetical protein
MAKFLKLHQRNNKEEVFVNVDNIVSFRDAKGLDMTRISTTNCETIFVAESVEEIVNIIIGKV